MARSPLISAFSKTYRLLAQAKRTGIPAVELAQREAEARVRRRRFLAMSAAAASIPLIAAGCESPEVSGNSKVVIVGGGMAGVHCAYRLKQAGYIATLYEASNRLGGRMFSDRKTFPDGQHCELGGELIDTGHVTMHTLAAELGIELYNFEDDVTNGMGAPIAQDTFYFGGQKLTMAEVLAGFSPIADEINKAFEAFTDPEAGVTYADPNGAEALDAMSIRSWLDSIGASGPVRNLLEVAYLTEYGLETDVSNVLNLLLLISTDTMTFEAFGESDELFHTKEGNDLFIQKLAERLDDGQVELGSSLSALAQEPDGSYTLTFGRDSGSFTTKADHVVLALPFSVLRNVKLDVDLPEEKLRAIQELGYGTNSKLMCGFGSRPWRDDPNLANGSFATDLAIQYGWETSRLQPGPSGILTNFTGGDVGVAAGDGLPSERMAEFLDAIDVIFPGTKAASNGKVVRKHWPSEPRALGSYAAYMVGQYTAFAGAEIERVQNLHFCGEHTSLDAQGYMEGAAITGAMAATEVADDLDLGTAMEEQAKGSAAAMSIVRRARITRQYGSYKRALARWAKAKKR